MSPHAHFIGIREILNTLKGQIFYSIVNSSFKAYIKMPLSPAPAYCGDECVRREVSGFSRNLCYSSPY